MTSRRRARTQRVDAPMDTGCLLSQLTGRPHGCEPTCTPSSIRPAAVLWHCGQPPSRLPAVWYLRPPGRRNARWWSAAPRVRDRCCVSPSLCRSQRGAPTCSSSCTAAGCSGHDVAAGHDEGDAGQPGGAVGGQKQHPAIINTVAFNPHGETLATSSMTTRFASGTWPPCARSARPARAGAPRHRPAVRFLLQRHRVRSQRSHLIALYQSGVGIVWDVDPKLWERRACTVAGRTLTQEEWKELLPARSYQPTCR
jgi:hypothetical protein